MTLPAEIVEAGRRYLERDATALSVDEVIARVDTAAGRLRDAAMGVPEGSFEASRADGWSARECLAHVVGWNMRNAQQILYVALSGELPPEAEPEVPAERGEALAKHQEALDSLYVHVRDAEPEGFLYVRWEHPFFGELNWREWLLFLELHCIDHAGQLTAMAVG